MTYAEMFLLVWCIVATLLAVIYRTSAHLYFSRCHATVYFAGRLLQDEEFFDAAKADFEEMGQMRIQIREKGTA